MHEIVVCIAHAQMPIDIIYRPRHEKPFLGLSGQMRLKPACPAIEISYEIEISLVAKLDMIRSSKRITKMTVRMRRLVCTFVVRHPKDRFSRVKSQDINSTLNSTYKCAHINGLISPLMLVRSFSNFQQT